MIILDSTTIQVSTKVKRELDGFKDYERETYCEVIGKLIELVKEDEESKMQLSEETLKDIKEAEQDIKKGKVYTTAQIKRELGI